MFSKLKNLLILEDAPVVAASTPQQQQQQPSLENPVFIEALASALKEKALLDYDYMKFIEGKKAMSAVVPDEAVCFKVAFLAVKALGVTKQKLITTAQFYLSVLVDERKEFLSGLDDQMKDKVGGSQQRLQDIEKQIASKIAKIAEITTQLEQEGKEKIELEGAITEWTEKIKTTSAEFEISYQKMHNTIEQDIVKINTLLDA